MTNDEYRKIVHESILTINHYEKETLKITKTVLGKNMISEDLPYLGFLDRSINLARGFILMLENRNLTCSGAILRLLIDNCLRLYAINIAADREATVNAILKGEKISKLRDSNGKKMTDAYLNEKLEYYDKHISNVYKETSGFIHFSNKAVYQSITEFTDDGRIQCQVGGELPNKFNETLIECAVAYVHFYRLFLSMMCEVAVIKIKIDNSTS